MAGGDKTQVFHSAEELINSDYARAHPFTDAQKEALRNAEGFFDPRTGQTVLIAGNVALRPGETPQAALTRVMLHERVGHEGLNAMLSGPPLPNGKPSLIQQRWANLQKRMPQAELDAIAAEPGYAHLKGNQEALALEWFARQAEAHRELLNKPSLVSVMWGNFKESVVDLMTRMGLEPPQGKDLDTQVMALLQRARQSAVKGGSGPHNGTLGQDLQFSMGDGGQPATQGGNGTALPGTEGSAASGGDPAATPPSPGSAVPPGPVLSVEQSKQLITNVTALAAQGPLTPRQQADLDQAKRVVAQDTVNRLQGQPGPLSEAQKQELAEAQGLLDGQETHGGGQAPASPPGGPLPTLAEAQTTVQSLHSKAADGSITPEERRQYEQARKAVVQDRAAVLEAKEANGTITPAEKRALDGFRKILDGTMVPPPGYNPLAANAAHQDWYPPHGSKPVHPPPAAFTPEAQALTDQEIRSTVDRLKSQGHAYGRHGPDVLDGQLDDRVLFKVDPMTQTRKDKEKAGNHSCAGLATQFTSERAMAHAVKTVTGHPRYAEELQDALDNGDNTFNITMKLEDVFGPGYKQHVRGKAAVFDGSSPPNRIDVEDIDFSNGTIFVQFKKDSSGNFYINTMFANPQ